MKKTLYYLFILATIASCKKKEATIDDNKPVSYTYNQALSAIGIEPDVKYAYDKMGVAQWEVAEGLRFHGNGRTITEYSNYFGDSLVYDVGVRVVQPTMVGELPKIIFTPYDRERHTLLTNMEKWQSLNFLRYTTDSAVLQKGTVVFFESLGKVKYEGPQELRKK